MAKPYDGGTKDEFTQYDYDYWLTEYSDTEWPTFVHYPLQGSFLSPYFAVMIGMLILIGKNWSFFNISLSNCLINFFPA